MKRRDFLAASAVLSFFTAIPALAANKKKTPGKQTTKKTSAKKTTSRSKPSAKKGKKSKTTTRSVARPAPEPAQTATYTPQPTEAPNVISLPDEKPAQWKTYDIRTEITLNRINGKVRLWVPLAQYRDTPWERSFGHSWQGNFQSAGIYRDPIADMEVFYADWADGGTQPQLHLTSQVATQDRNFDITRRGAIAERGEVLRRNLQETALVPTDGIVRRTAEQAIGRIKDPLAQAKALYDWVVDNTEYDPAQNRVGHSNIATLLESGKFHGRSADIALLFVGLCRSMGIPARPVFGLRLDRSRLFGSLGASGNLQTAQHCRAEFYSPGYGWIAVNPADVRKAIRDEGLSSSDSRLTVLKKLLFGFWEMNWISFNAAQDVALRDSTGSKLPFLLYPVVETNQGRFDSMDSNLMTYRVTASRSDYETTG
ncbi:transglutaminase-like domain-containing protein [Propionivibrio limicola]|uniref:transglutaminase-like domain-containing protein n=1 Tax=Propionivibrio limicola TaxID=167645 RepID=UPI001291081A|nr:transglutaminase-like domain-containing protein [Propionivibrio limicola]